MSIPDGITTALVHLDAPVSFIGSEGRIHATIRSSAPLIWAATGTPIGNFVDNVALDPGVPLEVHLPHTDQPGFLDGVGNTITGWYYTVEVTYERDGQTIPFPARDFQIITGQENIDLALIPAGEAVVPATAPIGVVTDVAGVSGSVTLQELGLHLVDNTPDADKPISTAVQQALGLKSDGTHVHAPATATENGFMSAADKAALNAATESPIGGTVVRRHADGWADFASVGLQRPTSEGLGHNAARKDYVDGKVAAVTYASLGTVPTSALPSLAINETFPVSSQAAMLALAAQRGDMAIRSDTNRTFVLATDSPGTLADWKEVSAAGQVTAVAGRTGNVVLAKADVGLSAVDNTADANKPVSTATQTALNGKADTGHSHTLLDGATLQATPSTLMQRDSAGRVRVADPIIAEQAATKGYVDGAGAAGAWVNLTLANGWVPYVGGGNYYQGLRARRMGRNVQIQGMIKSGTTGILAVLPTELHPAFSSMVTAVANGSPRTLCFMTVTGIGQDGVSAGNISYDGPAAAPAFLSVAIDLPLP